jgi:hypothetical protein
MEIDSLTYIVYINKKPIGEIYPTPECSWGKYGSLHYKTNWGVEGYDTFEQAIDELLETKTCKLKDISIKLKPFNKG